MSVLLCGALALSIAGCTEPLGPQRAAGVYALDAIDGAPLPAYVYGDLTIGVLLADTLTLSGGGNGSRVSTIEHRSGTGVVQSRFTSTTAVRVRVHGGQLYLTYPCTGPIADCAPSSVQLLTPVGSSAYLRVADEVWHYRRAEAAP